MNKSNRPYGPRTLKSQFSKLKETDELSNLIRGNMSEWDSSKHGRKSDDKGNIIFNNWERWHFWSLAVPGKHSPNGGTANYENKPRWGPEGQIFGYAWIVEDVGLDHFRVVWSKASQAIKRGGRVHKLHTNRILPILWIELHKERWKVKENGTCNHGVQGLWEEVDRGYLYLTKKKI